MTRIAKINAPLWTELFLYNKKELLTVMENFQTEFDRLKTAIEQDDQTSIMTLLEEATSRRIALEKADSKLQAGRD